MKALAKHFDRSPAELGPEHIRTFHEFLVTKKASWSAFNQAVCAFRFFYRTTLQSPFPVEQIPFSRQPAKLPVVLSPHEVGALFAAITNLKHRTALMTIYGAGLRLDEAIHLRVEDIDSELSVIRVLRGKGQKDRYTLLTTTLLSKIAAAHHDTFAIDTHREHRAAASRVGASELGPRFVEELEVLGRSHRQLLRLAFGDRRAGGRTDRVKGFVEGALRHVLGDAGARSVGVRVLGQVERRIQRMTRRGTPRTMGEPRHAQRAE